MKTVQVFTCEILRLHFNQWRSMASTKYLQITKYHRPEKRNILHSHYQSDNLFKHKISESQMLLIAMNK